jgi:hypothetical protein
LNVVRDGGFVNVIVGVERGEDGIDKDLPDTMGGQLAREEKRGVQVEQATRREGNRVVF